MASRRTVAWPSATCGATSCTTCATSRRRARWARTRRSSPRPCSRSSPTSASPRSPPSWRARKKRSSRCSAASGRSGERMPARYVAIIMDGNGRWAQQRGLDVNEGHREGARALRRTVENAVDLGLLELTAYAFSTENWTRPSPEVEAIMELFGEMIETQTPDLLEEGVRMRFIGRREGVAEDLLRQMEWAERETRDNEKMSH